MTCAGARHASARLLDQSAYVPRARIRDTVRSVDGTWHRYVVAMSTPELITLAGVVATVFGAVAAFVGVFAGQLLTRSTEYKKWLRHELHVACTKVLSASSEARDSAAFVSDISRKVAGVEVSGLMRAHLSKNPEYSESDVDTIVQAFQDNGMPERLRESVLEKFDVGFVRRLSAERQQTLNLVHAVQSVRLLGGQELGNAASAVYSAVQALQGNSDPGDWARREVLYIASQELFVLHARERLHSIPLLRLARERKTRARMTQVIQGLLEQYDSSGSTQG